MPNPCNCITDINSKLEEHKLDVSICFSGNELVARTYTSLQRKDNGRAETRSKKPCLVAHKFCPFCGTRYEPEPPKPIKSSELIALLDDPKIAESVNEKGGGRFA